MTVLGARQKAATARLVADGFALPAAARLLGLTEAKLQAVLEEAAALSLADGEAAESGSGGRPHPTRLGRRRPLHQEVPLKSPSPFEKGVMRRRILPRGACLARSHPTPSTEDI